MWVPVHCIYDSVKKIVRITTSWTRQHSVVHYLRWVLPPGKSHWKCIMGWKMGQSRGWRSGSPPKCNRLFFGPPPFLQKISSKSVHKLLRYTAECQFTPSLLMVKNHGKWSKVRENIRISTDNVTNYSLGHASPLQKILSKSVQNFLRYFVHTQNRTNTLPPGGSN